MAIRSIASKKAFSLPVIATLSMAIGINASIFALIDAALLRSLPYPQPDRIVSVTAPHPQAFVRFTLTGFEPWPPEVERIPGVQSIGLYATGGVNLGGEVARRMDAAEVTPAFFRVLGVAPALGRHFTADDQKASLRVAVISDRLWRTLFLRSRDVLGSPIVLNGKAFTVIGVMPPRVRFPGSCDVWLPPGVEPQIENAIPAPKVLARLTPEISTQQAAAPFEAILSRGPSVLSTPQVRVRRLRDVLVGDLRPIVLVLGLAGLLVLAAACVNVGHLIVVRMSAREREFAVRSVLGASRLALLRQMLFEAGALVATSELIALVLAWSTLGVARAMLPSLVDTMGDLEVNATVLALTSAVGLLLIAAFGLVSIVSVSERPWSQLLRTTSGATVGPVWQRLRGILVVAQLAAAVTLLMAAVALTGTIRRLTTVDLGVREQGLLTFELTDPLDVLELRTSNQKRGYRGPAHLDRLLEEISRLPTVEHVAAASIGIANKRGTPLAALRIRLQDVPVPDTTAMHHALRAQVTSGYFATAGIDVIAGRVFGSAGTERSPEAIVSEGVARAMGLSAMELLGRRIDLDGSLAVPEPVWAEIVGVVRDVRWTGPESTLQPTVYELLSGPVPAAFLTVRSNGDPKALIPEIRSVATRVAPDVPIYNTYTVSELRELFFAERRMAMVAMIAFGSLAFVLSAVGVFGLIAYLVVLRRKEIGIRLALGATSAALQRGIIWHGCRCGFAGVAVGLAGGWALWRLLSAEVYGLQAISPLAIVLVATFVLLAAVVATWLPSRDVLRIDPAKMLGAE